MIRAPLLIHSHMPKTAGSALNRNVLWPRFASSAMRMAYGVAFEKSRRFPEPLGEIGFLSGHAPYGYGAGLGREVLYISVLRDPVDRMFSFLNFVAIAGRHGARRQFDEDMQAVARKDPERFVLKMLESELVQLRQNNLMVRLASGMPRLGRHRPGRHKLRQAITHSRKEDYLVGVQERFDEFAGQLRCALDDRGIGRFGDGKPITGDVSEKRFEKVISADHVGASVVDEIRRANALDQRFYDDVVERLECKAVAA
ncbi:MAG: hypothetical protein ACPGGK_07305 [Pikeienuella sp.]